MERARKAHDFYTLPAHNPSGTAMQLERMESIVFDCAGLSQREGAAAARYLSQQAAQAK